MVLPLVSTLREGGPGVMNSLQAINALQKSNIENQYLPITSAAEAASKLAYANLMGPQFLAKVLGNENLLANLSDADKQKYLNLVTNAGGGQGTGNALLTNPALSNVIPKQSGGILQNLTGYVVNKLKEKFDGGYAPSVASNNSLLQQPKSPETTTSTNDYVYDKNGNNVVATPQEVANAGTVSDVNAQPLPSNQPAPNFAQNVANFKSIIKQGEEQGVLNAKDAEDLGMTYENTLTTGTSLKYLNSILSDPAIEQIRKEPLAGHYEIDYYQKFGTPKQQELIGNLKTTMGDIVANGAQRFKGQFRVGEQQLLNGMKPNPSDTVDTMRGKAEALSYFNQMLQQRTHIAAQYMTSHPGTTKQQALDIADKQMDGEKIRQQISRSVNTAPSKADISYMAKKYNISEDEVIKRLKQKGIL